MGTRELWDIEVWALGDKAAKTYGRIVLSSAREEIHIVIKSKSFIPQFLNLNLVIPSTTNYWNMMDKNTKWRLT